MIAIYSLVALFIAWIWVDYYRLIDIYEKEDLKYFVLAFLLGCASVLLVLGIQELFLNDLNFYLNGNFLNDLAFCTFRIGVVEEFAKFAAFGLAYVLFKKEFDEPIDYLAYICTVALGFSAVENVMYFYNYGPQIISGRAILSSIGHMFFTSLIGYGFVLFKFRYKKFRMGLFALFFFLSSLAHGVYDFLLMHEPFQGFGYILMLFFFLYCISFFAVMLNNSLNHSTFFDYSKVVDPGKVMRRLLMYYAAVFAIQFGLMIWFYNAVDAVKSTLLSFFMAGIVALISCMRLSRFKLIKERWIPFKFEQPYTIHFHKVSEGRYFPTVSIDGESQSDLTLTKYHNELVELLPISTRRTYLGITKKAYVERKVFLKHDEPFFLVKVFEKGSSGPFEYLLLEVKRMGKTHTKVGDPIAGLLKLQSLEQLHDTNLGSKDFQFLEWVVVMPSSGS